MPPLTEEQLARIEHNRQEAMAKRAMAMQTGVSESSPGAAGKEAPEPAAPALTDELRQKIEVNRQAALAKRALQQTDPAESSVGKVAPAISVPVASPVAVVPAASRVPSHGPAVVAARAPAPSAESSSAVSRRLDALVKSARGSSEHAVECHVRLVEAMQEDGGAEDFMSAMATRLDRVIVS